MLEDVVFDCKDVDEGRSGFEVGVEVYVFLLHDVGLMGMSILWEETLLSKILLFVGVI